MKTKHLLIPLLLVGFLAAIYIGTLIPQQSESARSGTGIRYGSKVYVFYNDWDETTESYKGSELWSSSSNVLYNNGKNVTRDILGAGNTAGAILNISLCNATAGCDVPAVAGSGTYSLYDNCGAENVQGTYASAAGLVGNWSVYNTFTASCDGVVINASRLVNESGSIFAGENFTEVTLQTNDQITINWTIWVE